MERALLRGGRFSFSYQVEVHVIYRREIGPGWNLTPTAPTTVQLGTGLTTMADGARHLGGTLNYEPDCLSGARDNLRTAIRRGDSSTLLKITILVFEHGLDSLEAIQAEPPSLFVAGVKIGQDGMIACLPTR